MPVFRPTPFEYPDSAAQLARTLLAIHAEQQQEAARQQDVDRQARLDAINAQQLARQNARQDVADQQASVEHDAQNLQHQLTIEQLRQALAAATPIAAAPRESGTAAGLPEVPAEAAGPAPSELQVPARAPKPIAVPASLGGGQIELPPRQYKEEAEAEARRKAAQTQADALQALGVKEDLTQKIRAKYREPKIEVKSSTDPLTGEMSFTTFKDGVPVRSGAGPGAAAGGAKGMPSDLTGDKLYSSLDPNLKALVDEAFEGTLDLTSKRLNPRQAHILALAKRINPDFNPTNAVAYNATVKEFQNTSPNKAGGNLSRINTSLEHLDEWKTAQKALANGDLAAGNRFAAFISREFGDPAITDFQTASAAVSDELAAAYKGGAPDKETQDTWRAIFADAGKSPQQAGAAYDRARALMKGRINGLRQNWRAGTNFRPKDGQDLWADNFDKFLADPAKSLYQAPPAAGTAAGAPGKTVGKYKIISVQ